MITIPKTMSAVLTKGHGGFEMLEFRNDINVPQPNSNQVLVKVLGAGVNNTDINTRTAWYSKSVTGKTDSKDFQGKDIDVKADRMVYRSYMHSDDLVEWLFTLAVNSNPSCPIYNVGSDKAIEIRNLATIISKIYNRFHKPTRSFSKTQNI